MAEFCTWGEKDRGPLDRLEFAPAEPSQSSRHLVQYTSAGGAGGSIFRLPFLWTLPETNHYSNRRQVQPSNVSSLCRTHKSIISKIDLLTFLTLYKGFIFTGEITHRMLTATQYIAPLMANFDPSFSKNSTVRYMDNGDLFVVQWDKVCLQGLEPDGPFTFQAALYSNGTIVFNYRVVPLPLEKINSTEHPVKVGLSDAFMALLPSSQSSDPRRRTIYEYHRVEIDITKIVSGSAFEFTPLSTCLQHTTCDLCLTSNLTVGCGWCNTLQRCSDGIDRHRQEWLDYNCPEEAKQATCEDYSQGATEGSVGPFNESASEPTLSPSVLPESPVTADDTKLLIHYNGGGELDDLQTGPPSQTGATENTAIIAGVVAALILLVALTLLAVYYINTHPTVAPPFYLMQRRTNNYWPSMKFRNQGCHSSYAEVELGGHEKEGFIEAEQCC
ncbi:plexin domain-containing protein 1-like isoform X4 [Osmerus eperlanus]|uniref:plexin domain-containing protein 1-like isoform X4 n=1 Tax=Osmerus eperlanus TaxID=29151 RepID=UPI002E121738